MDNTKEYPNYTKAEQLATLERLGSIKPWCASCKEFYDAPNPVDVFAPRHTAKSGCESGKYPHCTCDGCF